jgi:coenzyme F420-dependent glucose-6-phosphate dehydrogenase
LLLNLPSASSPNVGRHRRGWVKWPSPFPVECSQKEHETELGFSLSSEEHRPNALVEQARRAEEVGFGFALISDHFHPWLDQQGQSPFVWAVLGGIARETSSLRVGTGVTCPLIRVHPAIVAQAAATCGDMYEGRFFLGLGTGERLNEHVLGERWPTAGERREMLEEAIEVIRMLWEGGTQSHRGRYYRVEQARIYTLPQPAPPIYVAGVGRATASLAGRLADGLISIQPSAELVGAFSGAGGGQKPRLGQLTVCWAASEEEARGIARKWWPNAALPGVLNSELSTPSQFEAAAALVSQEMMDEKLVLGPDPERHLAAIEEFERAGFDHVYVHQVGPDQEGFFRFYEREVLPSVGAGSGRQTAGA